MINKQHNRKERLENFLGVLFYYIENSADELEREFFDNIAHLVEQKIKEIE